jgi:hypothetical protein
VLGSDLDEYMAVPQPSTPQGAGTTPAPPPTGGVLPGLIYRLAHGSKEQGGTLRAAAGWWPCRVGQTVFECMQVVILALLRPAMHMLIMLPPRYDSLFVEGHQSDCQAAAAQARVPVSMPALRQMAPYPIAFCGVAVDH